MLSGLGKKRLDICTEIQEQIEYRTQFCLELMYHIRTSRI